MRSPLGSSTAAARTKPSNAPETVAPATPAKIGSSLRTPETKVKDPLSLTNGIASWTRLIWPMSLLPNDNCNFSAVSSESGGKGAFPCPNGHGNKGADGLIKLPDTFAALDLDFEIARFASDLDYLMASTRQCLLNQFPDLSVCANQNNFHKNSILPA